MAEVRVRCGDVDELVPPRGARAPRDLLPTSHQIEISSLNLFHKSAAALCQAIKIIDGDIYTRSSCCYFFFWSDQLSWFLLT